MMKYAIALLSALSIASAAQATTGTATAGTVNVLRIYGDGVTQTIFTITGVSSAGTCPTSALDGTNTLVVWVVPTVSGSSATSANQSQDLTSWDAVVGDVKAAQLVGSNLTIHWDDSKIFGGSNYCYPVYIQ